MTHPPVRKRIEVTLQSRTDDAKHPTIIPIDSRLRLRADPMQWIVEEYGGKSWRGVRFFRSLDKAAISVLDTLMKEERLHELPDGWLECFQDLMHRVDAAKVLIVRAVRGENK